MVLHCVLSELKGVQTTDRLVPSGPVEHDIIDVVTPYRKREGDISYTFMSLFGGHCELLQLFMNS